MIQPILVFGYGNPSRGDDAIGPDIIDRLLTSPPPSAEFLTDFQLQIEHTQDLVGRQAVIFIDASLSCRPPYEFLPIKPESTYDYTTHAMSPQAVLSVYEQVNHQPAPIAYLLSIRGYQFELGQPISDSAQQNVRQVTDFLTTVIAQPVTDWLQHT